MTNNNSIYALGDIHGEWGHTILTIKTFDLRDCVIISVGDIGIGLGTFGEQEEKLSSVNELLKDRNIEFMGVRGNHDDPEYFQGDYNFSNMSFLKDYTVKNIFGRKFQFVGGAVSIDRVDRLEDVSWWRDEIFNLDLFLAEKCDVLITHSAPSYVFNAQKCFIETYLNRDESLWDDLVKERKDHDLLIDHCQPNKHYCGHFHISQALKSPKEHGCESRILDINELILI